MKVYAERTWGDKYIGEVKIPVKALFARRRAGKEASIDVDGTEDGKLNVLYSFGRMFTDEEPSSWIEALKAGFKVVFVVMVQDLAERGSDGGWRQRRLHWAAAVVFGQRQFALRAAKTARELAAAPAATASSSDSSCVVDEQKQLRAAASSLDDGGGAVLDGQRLFEGGSAVV
ncbi:hypothetical protein SASPL_150157 [Salvia splendens]|uniref:Uncharacterized protein n=1 Tax=Salvia splendens TaxID=180675 RepID=A0A8X8W5I5_SALSN|nr:hypothetical protein SASPL_150157 [Salvia splendens]